MIAPLTRRSSLLPLLCLLLLPLVSTSAVPSSSAHFNETLLLRPLHDGNLLMHWQFEVRACFDAVPADGLEASGCTSAVAAMALLSSHFDPRYDAMRASVNPCS